MEQQQKPKRKTRTSNAVISRYVKKTYREIKVRLRKVDDADLIAKLDSVPSMNEYIRQLIRADMAKEK